MQAKQNTGLCVLLDFKLVVAAEHMTRCSIPRPASAAALSSVNPLSGARLVTPGGAV